jgi:hypothetical protein
VLFGTLFLKKKPPNSGQNTPNTQISTDYPHKRRENPKIAIVFFPATHTNLEHIHAFSRVPGLFWPELGGFFLRNDAVKASMHLASCLWDYTRNRLQRNTRKNIENSANHANHENSTKHKNHEKLAKKVKKLAKI